MKKDIPAKYYNVIRHALNGVVGFLVYVVTFLGIAKTVEFLMGVEEARENLPVYVSFYIGACCLVVAFVVLQKVRYDLGVSREAGGSFILYAVIGFAVQFIALNLMSSLGFLPIEILIYQSFLILILSALVSYRFFREMTSGKKTRRPRR